MTYKTELAQRYFPQAAPRVAVRHLNALINMIPECVSELQKAGLYPIPRRHYFTPREVEIIQKHLGPPHQTAPQ